jgi:DNA-binding XRE family transcriptional regulator
LLDKAGMLDDVAAHDRAKAALASGDDELLPAMIVDAILDGENPVRVRRPHREMPQSQLAEAAGISQAYLAQIETGKREGTASFYRSLADVPEVDLGDLLT